MKILIIIILIMFISLSLTLQAQKTNDYTKELIEQKIKSFRSMKTTGMILTFTGIPLLVIGTPIYFKSANVDDLDVGGMWIGAVMMISGELMTAGGIVLWSIGGSKTKKYKKILKEYKPTFSFGVTPKGFSLKYNF